MEGRRARAEGCRGQGLGRPSPASPFCHGALADPGWFLLGLLVLRSIGFREPRVGRRLAQHLRPLLLQLAGYGARRVRPRAGTPHPPPPPCRLLTLLLLDQDLNVDLRIRDLGERGRVLGYKVMAFFWFKKPRQPDIS